MSSLRWRLMLLLSIAVCVVGVAAAALSYHQVSAEAKELLDQQLQQIANIVAEQTVPRPDPLRSEDSDIDVAVWNADGTLQYSSITRTNVPRTVANGFSEITLKGEPYRVYAADLAGRHIEVAQPVDVRDDQAEAAAGAALLPALILLPVLAIVIALVTRALLQPVRSIAEAVSRRDALTREPLDARGLPQEVVPLIDEINRLLQRQNAALLREQEFIADAAHALRTPLAALQLQADVLEGSQDPEERAARLAALRQGIRRTSHLSDQMLSLARIDSGSASEGQSVIVDATLHDVAALYEGAMNAAGVTLTLSAKSRAEILCDRRSVLLICTNLFDNALRHTPSGGRIEMVADTEDDWARVEIRDQGPGLAEDQLERVFLRFYQVPGQSGGSGLGLSMVASLVRRCGGRVTLENRTDRKGLIARVLLPRRRSSHESKETTK
jgi:two-component system, OmpR family, sensor kinase